jgi:hypothetical protein
MKAEVQMRNQLQLEYLKRMANQMTKSELEDHLLKKLKASDTLRKKSKSIKLFHL